MTSLDVSWRLTPKILPLVGVEPQASQAVPVDQVDSGLGKFCFVSALKRQNW